MNNEELLTEASPSENLFKLFEDSLPDPLTFSKSYLAHVRQISSRVNVESIAEFIGLLEKARLNGNTIFFAGNGGSAATASHFANDLAIGTRLTNQPFRAISLTDNVAIITAIANDIGYESIFSEQLRTLAFPNDMLVAISASGNSPNILRAVEFGNSIGMTTVGLTGFTGGKLKTIVRHALHVPTAQGEYGPVEDLHMILDHLVGGYFQLKRLYETSVHEKQNRLNISSSFETLGLE